jgi:hypothetical protein
MALGLYSISKLTCGSLYLCVNAVSVLIAVGTLLTTCHGDGEYIVLRAPPSVRFRQQPVELLPVSDIPLIALATFGYSPQPVSEQDKSRKSGILLNSSTERTIVPSNVLSPF